MEMAGEIPASKTVRLSAKARGKWTRTLRELKMATKDSIVKVAEVAKEITAKGHKEIQIMAANGFNKWFVESDASRVGALHRYVKPRPRCETGVASSGVEAEDPAGKMEIKGREWADAWGSDLSSKEAEAILQKSRARAQEIELPPLTLEKLDQTTGGIATNKAKAIESIWVSDIENLPKAGRVALVKLLQNIEARAAWPWQLLMVIVVLLRKPGERAVTGPSASFRR